MHSARALIEALGSVETDAADAAVAATSEAVDAAVKKIEELRALFFNLIEHLPPPPVARLPAARQSRLPPTSATG